MALVVPSVRASAQRPSDDTQTSINGGVIQGHVRDVAGDALANVTVSISRSSLPPASAIQTDVPPAARTNSEGTYRFVNLAEGAYTLRAELSGYAVATDGPTILARKETKNVDLVLDKTTDRTSTSEQLAHGKAPPPEFFDEPQFTVAGVTQATNSGGHGSDAVLRTTEALAKATLSLSKEPDGSSGTKTAAVKESSLRDILARDPDDVQANLRLGSSLAGDGKPKEALAYLRRSSQLDPSDAETHHLLGDIDENLGNPLEAVREYQRAAELNPSEPNLFDWGADLLNHRALEPATEVFVKGNRLFPKSVRMLLALGVAWYARGFYDQATQCLITASDLAPDDPTPYLFLGKMQSVELTSPQASDERLARFARLHPDNALANYYYGVSLWKRSSTTADPQTGMPLSAQAETLLRSAVKLDPKLGSAYLQLGILYAARTDFSRAIEAYEKAIEVSPQLDQTTVEAHYRLAQAYHRIGDQSKAQEELDVHSQLVKKTKEVAARQRRDLAEFVISLQNEDSVRQPKP
ncbi:MAG: tetratricopeptide repeat protein [Terriglobales bacterium]